MKFEIPFDSEIQQKELSLNFKLIYKPHLKKNRVHLIVGLLLCVLGLFVINKNSYFHILSIFLSAFYFLIYGNYLYNYYKRKKVYFKNVDEQIYNGKKYGENIILEFNDDHFRFCDYKIDIRLKWFSFKGYRLVNNVLFLDQTEEKEFAIMVSKDELGEDNFNQVLDLVREKVSIK